MDGVPSWIRDMGGAWWRGRGRRRAREGAYLLFKINTSPVASTLVWQRRIVKDQYVPVDKSILLREGLEGLPLTLLHQVTHGPTPRLPRSEPISFLWRPPHCFRAGRETHRPDSDPAQDSVFSHPCVCRWRDVPAPSDGQCCVVTESPSCFRDEEKRNPILDYIIRKCFEVLLMDYIIQKCF